MSGKSDEDNRVDWPKAADNAEKKATEEVEKIKREAHEELNNTNQSYNNPDDK